jgi:ribosomal protein L7Ae-like RNA K-turn-binding protein
VDTFELLLPYLNQARRKRSLELGQEAVRRALAQGRCRLLFLAADAGESLRRMKTGQVPVIELGDRQRLGDWLGREQVAVLGLTDADLAAGILKRLRSD